MISEETLRQMPAEDRAALARSLAAVNDELPSLSAAEHRRRRLVLMLTVASAVLIPGSCCSRSPCRATTWPGTGG